jgi:hypothetical protein
MYHRQEKAVARGYNITFLQLERKRGPDILICWSQSVEEMSNNK